MAKRVMPQIFAHLGPTDDGSTTEIFDNFPELTDRLRELKAQGFTALKLACQDKLIGFCCFRPLKSGGERAYNLELEGNWDLSYQEPEVSEEIASLLGGELSDPV